MAKSRICVSPSDKQSTPIDFYEPVMIAPLQIRKTSRLPTRDETKSSCTRDSSDSSGSSNHENRTELEEILSRHSLVEQVATTTPRAGLLEGKMVVFTTLSSINPIPRMGDTTMISPSQTLIASAQVATLRRVVDASVVGLPTPDVWVVLKDMPLTNSGEVDKRRLRTWAQNINEETYRRVMRLESQDVLVAPSTEMERCLQRIVSELLQTHQDHIGMNFTFGQLGGDDATAIELVARCKHETIYLNVEEILQNATLAELALMAPQGGALTHEWQDEISACFELSPMQQLYFLTSLGGYERRRNQSKAGYRFNQSHLMRVTMPCMVEDIHAAIEAVVGHHLMLRCRFVYQCGSWSQRILPDVAESYAFHQHSVSSDDEVKAIIERSQATIDIQSGPVFSVDYMQTHDGQQLIYLLAHHLVVDLPSWRVIIHDLNELLENGSLLSQRSTPFSQWIGLQQAATSEFDVEAYLLPEPVFDRSYWGLQHVSNSYEDAIETSFCLNSELTSVLQGTCNLAFRTDPADIHLASLLLSFSQTFTDRPVPIVWNQEHARDSCNSEVDISEAIGRFTSMSPLTQQVNRNDNIIDVLRMVKDDRRTTKVQSSLDLVSRLCKSRTTGTGPLDDCEIVFNHTGSLDDIYRSQGILERIAVPGQTLASRTSDIGPTVGRIAVFEVNAMVEDGVARVMFVYNRCSKHQERILTWISNYEHVLLEAIGRLKYHVQELTQSDVPFLDITIDGLRKLNRNCVQSLKVSSIQDIEAIYPVTANQQHILVGRAHKPESNIIRSVFEFTTPTKETMDTSRLCVAWQLVTTRHASLRTVFVESVTHTGLYDQIVLRRVSPDMLFIDTVSPDDAFNELSSLPGLVTIEAKPTHRVTVCKTSTRTLLSLDVSAAICDAASVDIIMRDLLHTYSTQRALPAPSRFAYPDYLEMLNTTRQGSFIKYWMDLLATTCPCLFPSLTSRTADGRTSNVHLQLDVLPHELEAAARSQGVPNDAVVQLAWALVLRAFTGANDTCFGYSTSGRERSVAGLSEAVGAFANTITCLVRLLPHRSVKSALRVVDEHFKASLLHQSVSIAEIEHALGIKGGTRLFNTLISYAAEAPDPNSKFTTRTNLELKPVFQQHCTSLDLSLHLRHDNRKLMLDVSSFNVPEEQLLNIANAFGMAVKGIITSVNNSIGDISLFGDRDYAQILAWGIDQIGGHERSAMAVVHDLVTRHAFQNPGSQAVCAWDGDLSYEQMVGHATTLAHYLVDNGVGPNGVVPVVLEKSRWAPVAMLAVMKTGAAFVPVDVEELGCIHSIFNQLDAKVIITAGQAASMLGDRSEKVIVLNDSLFLQMRQYSESLPSIATPDDTACILFRPTSTKEARGIQFTHRALSVAFLAQGPAARITARSRVMQISSFSSDIALSEIFTTLAHGGCVCIPSSIERLQNYATDVRRMRVNWTYLTSFLSRKLDPTLLPTLKVVCFRTSSLDEDTYSAWAGKADVVLAYGAPEVCPLGISFLEVVGPDDLKSIGQPIAGNFWIVNPDNRRNLVPIGAVGELVFEGPTIGSSYPTAKPDHVEGTKTRYYKAGHHRVRYLEDGVMQFISSPQEDVNIRGRAVNLPHIEKHLRRCLGQGIDVMLEAIGFPGAKDVPVLAAFVGLGHRLFDGREDLVNTSPAVREAVQMVKQLIARGLKNVVASHLIPSIIIPVTHLPMGPSLKVDRRCLRETIHGLSRGQLEALASVTVPCSRSLQSFGLKPLPLTVAEERLRHIMARVLSVEPAAIGSTDGFFDVGGDEVLAAKLVVACRHGGITASMADILRNSSLTELSQSTATADNLTPPEPDTPVGAVQHGGSTSEAFIEKFLAPKLGVERRAIKEIANTSAMQTRYIESAILRGRANIDYFTFAFSGGMDGNRLEEACQMLAIIHPILRTAFIPHKRQVYQAVLKALSVEFQRHSCPGWKLTTTRKKIISKDQSAPIAFNKPITKFMFIDAGKQSTLILRLSKAQYDDMSISLLVKDLRHLYDNTDNPPRRPSYCEFIKSINVCNFEDAQNYWQGLLDGAAMTDIVKHNRPHHLTTNVMTLRQTVLVGSLSNLGISFETVLKGAWAMVLAELSASPDVVFGEVIDGRHVRLLGGHSVASVMGPTINTIPVRIKFPDASLSPLQLLQYVHGQRIASIPFENMGFLDIVEKCTPWPYWTRFSTVVQHQHEETTVLPGKPKAFHLGQASCVLDVLESKAKDIHDLFVHSVMRQGKVELGLTFSTDRIPEEFAEHALLLLCETVQSLTSVNIMQPIIPSAHQYRARQKMIPVPANPAVEQDVMATPVSMVDGHSLSPLPTDQARAIQRVVCKAWTTTLNPGKLGVPEEHIHRAAFYDLWGSLIPAAQLAAHLNRALPKLRLPNLDVSIPIVSMEEIVDHPTMQKQFELIAAKMAAGRATPPPQTNRSHPGSIPGTGVVPGTSKKLPNPVSSSATTISKGFRRLTSTVTRSSAAPSPTPPTAATAMLPLFKPLPPIPITEISPLTPASQLPQLPTFSPVGPSVFDTIPADVGLTHLPGGVSPNRSSPASMTTGPSASSGSRHSAEHMAADLLGLLRTEVAGRVRLLTQGLGAEDVVSPLSASSGKGIGFWEGTVGEGRLAVGL